MHSIFDPVNWFMTMATVVICVIACAVAYVSSRPWAWEDDDDDDDDDEGEDECVLCRRTVDETGGQGARPGMGDP